MLQALAGAVVLPGLWQAGAGAQSGAAAEDEVRAVLTDFLRAFERGEIETMATPFAEATVFPRAIMGGESAEPIPAAAYPRVRGIEPPLLPRAASAPGARRPTSRRSPAESWYR